MFCEVAQLVFLIFIIIIFTILLGLLLNCFSDARVENSLHFGTVNSPSKSTTGVK